MTPTVDDGRHRHAQRANAVSLQASARVREIEKHGRTYLEFPIIAAREMVMNYPEVGTRELLPEDRIREAADMWAGKKLTYVHPTNDKKSADTPESYTSEVIGEVHEPEMVDDKLRVNALLDVEKAMAIGGTAAEVVELLRAGTELPTSAGYGTVQDKHTDGTHDGEPYDVVQGHMLPDHVAIFPPDSMFQARCTPDDGCAAVRANATDTTAKENTTFMLGEYVTWEHAGETVYGQVVEMTTDGCLTAGGTEKCAAADSDETVVAMQHFSEDGVIQRQRVVQYADDLKSWSDVPSDADSARNYYNNAQNVVLCGCLNPSPVRGEIIHNANVDGTDVDLTPPEEVQAVAQDFLDAVEEGAVPSGCATSSESSTGYQRAEQLAAGEELAVSDIIASGDGMYGWFQRHGAQDNDEVQTEQREDETEREAAYRDCGYAAWRSWGGDPAQDWVADVYDAIQSAQEKQNMTNADDPATHFQRFMQSLGMGGEATTNASEPESEADADSDPDDSDGETDGADADADSDDADSTPDSESSDAVDDDADQTDADDEEPDTETTGPDDSTPSDPEPMDFKANYGVTAEELAEHSLFTADMLEQADADDLDEEAIEAAVEQVESANESTETETDTDADAGTEPDADPDTKQNGADVVSQEQFNSLKESVDALTETISEKQNAQQKEQARIVANAVEELTEEDAMALPDSRLESLAEKHRTDQKVNYGAVPGSVDRTPDQADEDFSDIPAGGRSAWEARQDGD